MLKNAIREMARLMWLTRNRIDTVFPRVRMLCRDVSARGGDDGAESTKSGKPLEMKIRV